MKFHELEKGDMFNTISSRYVKINETEAIDVFYHVGHIVKFHDYKYDVIVLYSIKKELEKIKGKKYI